MALPADYVAALTDTQILVCTLYGEARGEPVEGVIAVGCVIRNRLQTGRWGASYAKVCLAPWQFSCWRREGGVDNYETVLEVARILATGTSLPDDALLRQCAWVAQGVVGGWVLDNTRDATHYFSPAAMVPRGAVPKWAVNKTPSAKKGQHLFFAGIK